MRLGGELGGLVAVEERRSAPGAGPRRWRRWGRRPARSAGSSSRARRAPTRLRTSSGSLFQSSPRAVAELVDQDRRPALGQEQQREAGRDQAVLLEQRPLPEAREVVLVVDQLLGPLAIPVVLAEEPLPGEPAGALQAVEVVVASTAGRARSSRRPGSGAASQSIPRWRLRLIPPLPQFWIASPARNSWPWNRFRPVMIRLEIPAQVMLAVAGEAASGV